MLQFAAEDALSKIYDDTINFFEERLYSIEPDLNKKLEVSEKTPAEYCNELVQEFRGNVTGQPVESIKNYTENLYYDHIYKLLKIRELHFEYYNQFGMDSDNERLANDYMAPLSILVTNIWRAGKMLRIVELKEFGDVNLKADFDLNGDYKPLFNNIERSKIEQLGQVIVTPTPLTPSLTTEKALRERDQKQPDENDELTIREKILIHCYKGQQPIKPGEQGYQDYMTFARPGDRTRYSGESTRKAKALIRSIENILPYLTDLEKEQAESEIDTIRSIFHNQL